MGWAKLKNQFCLQNIYLPFLIYGIYKYGVDMHDCILLLNVIILDF